MNKQTKDRLLENLSVAALLGVMALIVASASLFLDHAEDKWEKISLMQLAGAANLGSPVRSSDSAFRKIYPVSLRGKTYYAAVVSLKARNGAARLAAIVAADGSLDSVAIVDALPSDIPFAREGWFKEFLGKGGSSSYPNDKDDLRKPETISGATESFRFTSVVFGRLSSEVVHIASSAARGGN
jgi:hypothetical protein